MALRESQFQAFLIASGMACSAWPSLPCRGFIPTLPLSSHSLCVCVFIWLFYKHTSHLIRSTITQCDLILTNYICKTIFPNQVTSTGSRGWDFNIFSGGHNPTHSHTPPPHTSLSAQALSMCPEAYVSSPCQLSAPCPAALLFSHSAPATLVSSCSQTSLRSSLSLCCFTRKPTLTTWLKMENHLSKCSLSFFLLHFLPEFSPPSHRLHSVVAFFVCFPFTFFKNFMFSS